MTDDGEPSTPRKSQLYRSSSWTPRSPRYAAGAVRRPQPLALPHRSVALSGWPHPAVDDSHAGALKCAGEDICHVVDHVYLGSDAGARDREGLRQHGVTHVLNCVGSTCPCYFPGQFVYMILCLHDSPGEDLAAILYDAFDFLESAASASGRVFVHCIRGASRSAAVVVAYLMWRDRIPFDTALARVRSSRPAVDPNLGFAAQLQRRHPRNPTIPPSPGSSHRILRVTPHSLYTPLHLVPASVSSPAQPDFLDSRGAFLIHTPDAVFIWIGASCNPVMAAAARKIARQIAYYERVSGPVITIQEGSETDKFWAAAGVDDNNAKPGGRRVEEYDADYEIFADALKRTNDESPSSATPSSSSTPSSLEYTHSPASSPSSSTASDWYSSPSTPGRSEVRPAPVDQSGSELPPLHPWKEKKTDQNRPIMRKISHPLVSVQRPESDEQQPSECNFPEDWCSSPTFIPEVDSMDTERPAPSAPADVRDGSGEDCSCKMPIHPVLRRWPEMDKAEEIHPRVLDSNSVLLLLVPSCRTGAAGQKCSILYLWLGSNSDLASNAGEQGWDARIRSICRDFFLRMDLPADTPLEVIHQGKEPEQFLNHLFSFH